MKNVTEKRMVSADAVDQANLDLDLVRAFIDMLCEMSDNVKTVKIKSSTLAPLCNASLERLEKLCQFLDSIPVEFREKKAA